jgi:hypothetical protein
MRKRSNIRRRQFEALEARTVLDTTVVFNEIMYNPGGADESLEWIELYNQLAVNMDISGWRLRDGINFDFPAGTVIPADGYLVLAANPAAVEAASGLTGVLGPYTGFLSNGGEEIELLNNSDRVMDQVEYGDNDPWPVAADGSGASLAKIDEAWAASDVTNWRASAQIGGTPGAANFPVPDLTPTTTKPVGLTSTWRYNDTGTDLGTAWREPSFVDSGWAQGPALFTAGTESSPALGLRYQPVTGDADIGINTSKTYTHKLDFGSGDTGATINGVAFTQVTSTTIASVPNFTWQTSSGATSTTIATAGSNVTGSSVQLFQDAINNAINAVNGTVTITISGLTAGAHYDTRIYTRQQAATGNRIGTFSFDTNLDGTPEATTTLNQNNATATPPGFSTANQAYAISYDFIATGPSMRIRVVQAASNTPWYFYGLTNEALGGAAVASPIDTLFGTGLSDNRVSLPAGTPDPHWYVTATQAPVLAMAAHPAWLANSASSQWTGLIADGGGNVPAGNYSFSTRFDLSAYDAATATISMLIGVDDSLTGVRLNGANTGITTAGFAALNGPFNITSGFLPGVNTLEFLFNNGGTTDNPSGLRVQFNATAVPLLNNTEVAEGPATHYFRREFDYAGNPAYSHAIEIDGLFDDGAVFYLNGQEIYRHNMPGGAVSHGTPAAANTVNAIRTGRVSVPAGALVVGGRNVLAAEVHQASGGNTDVRFGAELFIIETPVAPDDLPKIVINEMAAAGGAFFVELKNEDNMPIDVGGYVLKKFAPLEAQFVLPSQTLQPGQHLAITQAQLGFSAADNDRVILFLPGQTAAIDGRVVTPKLRGRSTQHDGRWLYPNAPTPGAANTFSFHDEIVINEIMYHDAPIYPTPDIPPTFNVTTLVPIDATWKFNRTGQNLGATWHQTNHAVDGVNWQSGQALLGVEPDGTPEPIRTTWPLDPAIITYYFQIEFPVTADLTGTQLRMRHIVDDGAVFYLNGVELTRSPSGSTRFFMTSGAFTSSTQASLPVGNATITTVELNPASLISGNNVLSVEVHQRHSTAAPNTDAVFGMELILQTPSTPFIPGAPFMESLEQWIELFNRGTSAVDLTGWKINGGVDYDFPAGTVINPGGYLVVAKDAAVLAPKYPDITIVGNLSGQLSNRNDLIRLDDASENPADEVHYYDDGYWPAPADGGGSSLELRDVDADNARPEAWAASIESDDSPWQTIRYRGVASVFPGSNEPAVWNELVFNLLDAGEFLVDDISVIESPSGTPIERIQNGNFNSGATAYRLVGNHGGHGLSGVIPEPGNPTNNVLHVVATGAGEHMSNHVETTFAANAAIVNGREYEISMRVKWLSGSPQLNTRLYFNRLARTHILTIPENHGTPGAPNSRAVANIGPTYDDLRHTPVIPQVGQSVAISVLADDPQGVATMTLKYSVAGGPFASVPMTLGSNGRYSGIIPGQSAASIVQFYVEGTDGAGAGAVSFFPAAGADSRALYKVADGSFTGGGRHNFRAIMTEADRARLHTETNVMSNHRMLGTVIWNERQVYYDAGIRLKGSGFSRANAGAGYNIRFHSDQPFLGVHEAVAIDPIISVEGRGASHRELIIKHIANAAGDIPMMYDDVINWMPPQSSQNTAAQLLAARYDDEFTSNQFEDGQDGTRFKLELIYYSTQTADGTPQGLKRPPAFFSSGFPVLEVDFTNMGDDSDAYRWNHLIRNNRAADDYSRIIELGKTFALTGSTVGSQLDIRSRAVIDVDEWMRVFAYESLAGINDTYNQGLRHNLQVYVRPEDQRVLALPWDQDFALHHATNMDIYGTGSNLRKIIDIPSNRRLFQGHLQDIINTTYNTTYLTPWISHYGPLATVNRTADITNYINARRSFVLGQLMAPVTFAITTNGGANFSVTTPTVTLEGNGWINVREIRLAGNPTPVDVTWIDQDSWRTTIPVSNGANALVLQAYDFQGNLVASDTITVTATYTVPDPLVHLRLTELMYHPADPTAAEAAAGFGDADEFEYIELQNIAVGPLNLAGLVFSDGIDFDFSTASVTTLDPGEHLVIVENIAAFNQRYGNPNVIIAGQYTGRLDNGGEHIRLENSAGAAIHDFTYDDNGVDWHISTDGFGPSLVIINPAGDKANWGLPTGWRPSLENLGSPGRDDALPGDVNGDARVDAIDLAIVQANLGTTVGATRGQGDLDGDGAVDRTDVAQVASNFGRSIAAPSPSAAAAVSPAAPARIRRPVAERAAHLSARRVDAALAESSAPRPEQSHDSPRAATTVLRARRRAGGWKSGRAGE